MTASKNIPNLFILSLEHLLRALDRIRMTLISLSLRMMNGWYSSKSDLLRQTHTDAALALGPTTITLRAE